MILRKYHHQIIDPADDLDSHIKGARFDLVVQYAPYIISPLRICHYSVDILLGRTTVADKEHILQVPASLTHPAHASPYEETSTGIQHDIEHKEYKYHRPGPVFLMQELQRSHENKTADDICLSDRRYFGAPPLQSMCTVQVACRVQNQHRRNHDEQRSHINRKRYCFD